jgi:hypothetical protein
MLNRTNKTFFVNKQYKKKKYYAASGNLLTSMDVMCSKSEVGKLYGPTALIWNKNTTRKTLKHSGPLTKTNQLIDWKIFRKPIKTPHKKTKPKEKDHHTTPY